MRFVLDVDMSTMDDKAAAELGRILRYWAGNLHHYELTAGDGSAIHDSAYQEVGSWRVTQSDVTE